MLLLDAAGTLIHPAEPVADVYARHLASTTGLQLDPAVLETAFRRTFAAAPPPDYALHPSGHAAERAWWKSLVSRLLDSLFGSPSRPSTSDLPTIDSPSRPSTFDLPTFDSLFDSLFTHYAAPAAWSLYPEVPAFLAAAADLGPLAVVSNFDDRLAPILDGLGIGAAFDHIVTSADARARKPDPAIFTHALALLDAHPAHTIHCGDSLGADVHGARAAGLRAFHLQRPAQNLFAFLDFCRS